MVEDDPTLALELQDYLGSEGFNVHWVSGVQAAEEALQSHFDLLVIDLTLPDGSGAELCARLRPYVRSGIVVCSGDSERKLRLELLRSGADAYLVKPVDPEELAAILTSVQRRVGPVRASPMQPSALPSMWRLDRVQQLLLIPAGSPVSLSQAECLLLAVLFAQADRFVQRQQLLAAFTSKSIAMNGPRLETLVSRLRSKIFTESGLRFPIRAWYGRGYSFTAHADLI
ncbi:MAG: response regulator transcription factor [Betaproteobacteria bacterium]